MTTTQPNGDNELVELWHDAMFDERLPVTTMKVQQLVDLAGDLVEHAPDVDAYRDLRRELAGAAAKLHAICEKYGQMQSPVPIPVDEPAGSPRRKCTTCGYYGGDSRPEIHEKHFGHAPTSARTFS